MSCSIDNRDLHVHVPYLTAYAVRQVRDRDLAQDLVQDTLVAALTGAKGFSGQSSLRTWLTGILKHKIMDAFRARARTPASLDEMLESGFEPGESGHSMLHEHGSEDADPALQLERSRFWEAFVREIDRMPARTAEAFVLSEFTDMQTDEVCEKLGVSAGALWVMRFRARDTLRKALRPSVSC